MASSAASPKLSYSEGRMKRSDTASISSICSCLPIKRISSQIFKFPAKIFGCRTFRAVSDKQQFGRNFLIYFCKNPHHIHHPFIFLKLDACTKMRSFVGCNYFSEWIYRFFLKSADVHKIVDHFYFLFDFENAHRFHPADFVIRQ